MQQQQSLSCPKCSGVLGAKRYGTGIDYLQCKGCKGLLLSQAALTKLRAEWMAESVVDTGSARLGAKHDRIIPVVCPNCAVAMQRVPDAEQIHVCMDFCPSCELLYLDAGELSDLKQITLVDHIWDFFKRIGKS